MPSKANGGAAAAGSDGPLHVDVAVTVDCNLFRGKTHVNPISRLLEPIANAIEHGRAARVDVTVEQLQAEMVFAVTEHGGAGMSPLDCEEAIRFGHHAAKAEAKTLQNYSHNGIGTKACLNFFSKLAIFSVQQRKPKEMTFVLLLLDVADKLGDGHCQPARRLVWSATSATAQPDWSAKGCGCASHPELVAALCNQLEYLSPAARNMKGVAEEFGKIGRTGSRLVYFGKEDREGTSEAAKQFILDGADVRVHPGALSSGATMPGARENTCPLYVTSLRSRLKHFLADPTSSPVELNLNGTVVETGGPEALFACIDEPIAPFSDEVGILGEVGKVYDPSEIKLECSGFKGVIRLGKSARDKGHRRWGTELLGDHFGTTQNGGCVVWVNGALVPLAEEGLWKHGVSNRGKKMRWMRAQGGTKWGMHIWGVVEMYPPVSETILDIGKERLMPTEGGSGTRAFLQRIGPLIDLVLGVVYYRDSTTSTNVKGLNTGGASLVGKRPVVSEELQGWLDNNLAAAAKAIVRKEKRAEREAQRSTEETLRKEGLKRARKQSSYAEEEEEEESDEVAAAAASVASAEAGGGARQRKAPDRLDPKHAMTVAVAPRARSGSGGGGSKTAAQFKAEKRHWHAERTIRESTRVMLLRELWKATDQPAEGKAMVGWMIEATGVLGDQPTMQDADEVANGRIVNFTPPDNYVVEWTDATQTVYAYSDLFSPGMVPLVLPVTPGESLKGWGKGVKGFKQPKLQSRPNESNRPKGPKGSKGSAAAATQPAKKLRQAKPEAAAAAVAAAAAAPVSKYLPATRTSHTVPVEHYQEGDIVSVQFDMVSGGNFLIAREWYDGVVHLNGPARMQPGFSASQKDGFSVVFDDGDSLNIDGGVWDLNGELWKAQQKICKKVSNAAPSASAIDLSTRGGWNRNGGAHKEDCWTEEEHTALLDLISRRGSGNWADNALELSEMTTAAVVRTEAACRAQWTRALKATPAGLRAIADFEQSSGRFDVRSPAHMADGLIEQEDADPASGQSKQDRIPWTQREIERLLEIVSEIPETNQTNQTNVWEERTTQLNDEFGRQGHPSARNAVAVRARYSRAASGKTHPAPAGGSPARRHEGARKRAQRGAQNDSDKKRSCRFCRRKPCHGYLTCRVAQAGAAADGGGGDAPPTCQTAKVQDEAAVVAAKPEEVDGEQEARPSNKRRKHEASAPQRKAVELEPIEHVTDKRWQKSKKIFTQPVPGSSSQYLVQRRIEGGARGGAVWQKAEELGELTSEPVIVEYERQIAHSADLELSLCAGKESLTIRCLLFGSPVPPKFEYICSCELAGAAISWTPRQDLLIQKGKAGAEQIIKLQHRLDRKGLAYDLSGKLRFARDVVYEPPANIFTPNAGFDRVVTNGRFKPLEVYHTGTSKGFGVWCPEKIREGEFVCQYIGEILTVEEAMARPDTSYQFELEIVSKPLDDVLSASGGAAATAKKGKATKKEAKGQEINKWPEAEYMIDAGRKGNVARFINHSHDAPALFGQMVFCSGHIDPAMPAIAMFAAKDIPAFTELTYDYGPHRERFD